MPGSCAKCTSTKVNICGRGMQIDETAEHSTGSPQLALVLGVGSGDHVRVAIFLTLCFFLVSVSDEKSIFV